MALGNTTVADKALFTVQLKHFANSLLLTTQTTSKPYFTNALQIKKTQT